MTRTLTALAAAFVPAGPAGSASLAPSPDFSCVEAIVANVLRDTRIAKLDDATGSPRDPSIAPEVAGSRAWRKVT